MNDELAEQTIEDHKYLLELVENKCAIAFYAVVNRNQSLYFALTQYYQRQKEELEEKQQMGRDQAKPKPLNYNPHLE